jgi:hypothetical protein
MSDPRQIFVTMVKKPVPGKNRQAVVFKNTIYSRPLKRFAHHFVKGFFM